MNSAKLKARVESMNAYLTAIRFPAVVSSYARVCTTDECRYRLWGITVAPRIPIAMYSFAGSARMEARGTKPPATARSEEHTSELQSRFDLVCRLLLEKKKYKIKTISTTHRRKA